MNPRDIDAAYDARLAGTIAHAALQRFYKGLPATFGKDRLEPGMGGVYEPKLMEKYIGLGMRFILSGSDLSFIMAGARERSKFLNAIKL